MLPGGNLFKASYSHTLKLSVLCGLLCIPSLLECQPIRFVRESLQLTLAADSFSFSGTYYFDNPGPVATEQSIYYPFVLSGSIPETTNIVEARTGKNIPACAGPSGVTFRIAIPPSVTQAYHISFVQTAREGQLEYILRSTKGWGQALERMTISIRVPSHLTLMRLSLKPDDVRSDGGITTYTVERENVMPEENLIVKWKRKTPRP
jgi:hypothetical protein